MRPNRSILAALLAIGLLPVLPGCGDDGEGVDVKAPWGTPTTTATSTSTGQLSPLVPADHFTYGVIGTLDVGGRTYQRFAGGYDVPEGGTLNDATPGTEVWLDGIGTDHVTISGLATHNALGTILPAPVTITLDEPVTVDIHPPVGVPQTQTFNGTGTAGNTVSLTANYTLADENATVETHMGTVSGCRHFTGTATVTGSGIPAALQGLAVTGEVWYSPSLGIVAAQSPDLGMLTDLQDLKDWAAPVGGVAVGQTVAVLDSTRTEVSLSTYDRVQQYDADKCVHAKMLAEVRWANDADAATLGQPDPTLFRAEFNGGMGTFCWGGCALTESPVSIFHPEDNGKGFKFWYAFISEALKNEYVPGGSKGSAYSIRVVKDASLPPIRVTMRIAYSLVSDSSDCSM